MPEQIIREGIYCVQIIFDEYHRALIVDELPEVEGMIRVIIKLLFEFSFCLYLVELNRNIKIH